MKKIILLIGVIIMLIAAHVAFGQDQEGVITYEISINVHRTLPADRQDMKAMVPEFRTFKQQLFFTATESLYKPLIEEEEEEDTENSGGRIRRVFRQRIEIYCNAPSGKVTSLQEFMGKDYLIDDSVRMAPWKFRTETKTITGYECKQAFYTDGERKQTITAWYTDRLRPFLGPDRFNTLPGAILAVDFNSGERVIVAKKIELRPLKKNELNVPTRGQKTTQAEFRKMVDEQMKKRRERGQMIIQN
ncbi:MAG TPA: GLPGLI family protein [Cyclobacteriaceae bacterium]|nr:GLPGLI family protein [Cyclobacteriaceae bacterium]